MGVMCVQRQRLNEQRQQRIQVQKSVRAAHSVYAKMVNEYLTHYGIRANDETRQFICECYNENYQSQTILLTPRTIQNNKEVLIERFELALNKNYQTSSVTFTDVDEEYQTLKYIWVVDVPSVQNPAKKIPIYYRCTTVFDEQNKFLKGRFQQFMPPRPNQPGPRPAATMTSRRLLGSIQDQRLFY